MNTQHAIEQSRILKLFDRTDTAREYLYDTDDCSTGTIIRVFLDSKRCVHIVVDGAGTYMVALTVDNDKNTMCTAAYKTKSPTYALYMMEDLIYLSNLRIVILVDDSIVFYGARTLTKALEDALVYNQAESLKQWSSYACCTLVNDFLSAINRGVSVVIATCTRDLRDDFAEAAVAKHYKVILVSNRSVGSCKAYSKVVRVPSIIDEVADKVLADVVTTVN